MNKRNYRIIYDPSYDCNWDLWEKLSIDGLEEIIGYNKHIYTNIKYLNKGVTDYIIFSEPCTKNSLKYFSYNVETREKKIFYTSKNDFSSELIIGNYGALIGINDYVLIINNDLKCYDIVNIKTGNIKYQISFNTSKSRDTINEEIIYSSLINNLIEWSEDAYDDNLDDTIFDDTIKYFKEKDKEFKNKLGYIRNKEDTEKFIQDLRKIIKTTKIPKKFTLKDIKVDKDNYLEKYKISYSLHYLEMINKFITITIDKSEIEFDIEDQSYFNLHVDKGLTEKSIEEIKSFYEDFKKVYEIFKEFSFDDYKSQIINKIKEINNIKKGE